MLYCIQEMRETKKKHGGAKMSQIEITTHAGNDIEIRVVAYASPAEAMTRDYPGCEADLEIEQIFLVHSNGEEVECENEIIRGEIEDKKYELLDEVAEAMQGEYDDYAYEQYRERQIMGE